MISHRTVREALQYMAAELSKEEIPDPMRDARLMLAKGMGLDPTRMTLHMGDMVTLDHSDAVTPLMLRRLNREPMSHILGERAFFGRAFRVSADVLDPRPETEVLVHVALEHPCDSILDLGTGSGCILITLLAERNDAIGIGSDVSQDAVDVAIENAKSLGVIERSSFEISDWYEFVGGTFDLIVSNPPYIAANEMTGLQPEVRDHEPRIALTDEADGLTHYRTIIAGAPDHLTPGGRLIVEIGPTQAKAVSAMMAHRGFDQITVHPDLDGRDRVVSARFPAK